MLNYNVVKNWAFPDLPLAWSREDSARYALTINLGADPLDQGQIDLAIGQAPAAFPTVGSVMGRPGHWLADPRTGVDHSRMLIGEVAFEFHCPLPSEGTGLARNRVLSVTDKGVGRGALIVVERQILDAQGQLVMSFYTTSFCRADGDFSRQEGGTVGGDSYVSRTVKFPEDANSIKRVIVPVLPQQALLFALNGDRNPIHIDPDRARKAGLPAPILHGMGTVGLLAVALARELGNVSGNNMAMLAGRFVAPVIPGSDLALEWTGSEIGVHFRALNIKTGKLVFDAGVLHLRNGLVIS